MKHSSEKKLFLEMLRHPENYSDTLLEDMMDRIDRPADVDAAWRDFCALPSVTLVSGNTFAPRRRPVLRWWHAVAAVAVVAVGIWSVSLSVRLPEGEVHLAIPARESPGSVDAGAGGDVVAAARPAADTHAVTTAAGIHTQAPPVRVRGGRDASSASGTPVFIVNGVALPHIGLMDAVETDDIEQIQVWKDSARVSAYEARLGSRVYNGIIHITLKKDKAEFYARQIGIDPPSGDEHSGGADCRNIALPRYPGGEEALRWFLEENVRCPSRVVDAGIYGKVIVAFRVRRDGILSHLHLLRALLRNPDGSVCTDSVAVDSCVAEALRVCASMPRWIPGSVADSVADMNSCLPVEFGRREAPKSPDNVIRIR